MTLRYFIRAELVHCPGLKLCASQLFQTLDLTSRSSRKASVGKHNICCSAFVFDMESEDFGGKSYSYLDTLDPDLHKSKRMHDVVAVGPISSMPMGSPKPPDTPSPNRPRPEGPSTFAASYSQMMMGAQAPTADTKQALAGPPGMRSAAAAASTPQLPQNRSTSPEANPTVTTIEQHKLHSDKGDSDTTLDTDVPDVLSVHQNLEAFIEHTNATNKKRHDETETTFDRQNTRLHEIIVDLQSCEQHVQDLLAGHHQHGSTLDAVRAGVADNSNRIKWLQEYVEQKAAISRVATLEERLATIEGHRTAIRKGQFRHRTVLSPSRGSVVANMH